MKKMIIFFLFTYLLLSGCSATPPSKSKPASTPMKAAKTFVKALTTGNEDLLNTVVYHTQSMPPNEIMNIAKMRKISGMKTTDFTYTSDPEDKETIYVEFKDSEGHPDKWRLVFLENEKVNNNYQYDGYLSGALLQNSTMKATTKSYLKALIKLNADLLYNLDFDNPPSGNDYRYEKEYAQSVGLNKKKLKDFKILLDGKLGKKIDHLKVLFKDKDGKKRVLEIALTKDNDGYYIFSSTTDY